MVAGLGWQAWLTIGVVLATLGLLWWGRLGPDKVLAGAAGLLMLSGVLTPVQALAGFWNPGVLTVAVLFVLVAALRSTGAIHWIGRGVLGPPRGELRARLRLSGLAGVLSAFVNNTPIVATLTSAVETWSRASGVPPSKLLLPMNYATILGGMCTLLGTSTNLIVAGLVVAHGLPAMAMFDPFPVAFPVLLAGLLYLAVASRWLLPVRRSAFDQAAQDAREYAVEMLVTEGGGLAGKSVAAAGLRHLKGSFLIELSRARDLLTAVGPDTVLRAGDRLVFVGGTDAVRELRRIPGLRPATDQWFKLDTVSGKRHLAELVLSRFSPAVGHTLRESGFRDRYGAVVIAVNRHGQRLHQKPGDVVMQAGDTLLVETEPDFTARFGTASDFLTVTLLDGERPVDRRRALTTLGILGVMVLANSVLGLPILWSAVGAALAVVLARCVRLTELWRSLDLRLLLVIACSFALGAAVDRTGVAAAVASGLGGLAGSDPFASLVLVYVMAVVFTELLTNNAAAILLFPIAVGVSGQLGVSPMPFVIALMIGASAGFMTPIGYQTNLMVYGPGGYRFGDYVRLGAPLSLVVGLVALWLIPRFFPF